MCIDLQPPLSIIFALRCLYTYLIIRLSSLTLDVVSQVRDGQWQTTVEKIAASDQTLAVLMPLAPIVTIGGLLLLYLAIARNILKGSGRARFLMLVILLATTASTVKEFVAKGLSHPYASMLWVVDTFLYCSATSLLFTTTASRWFQRLNSDRNS
jgi:hypothetical protein